MEIYQDFVRANSNYLTREDEPGLSITGDLTIGTWVYFDFQSSYQNTGIISKWNENTNQRSYLLFKSFENKFAFAVSADGITYSQVTDSAVNYKVSQWFYIVGRFTVSMKSRCL
jgi:hypothetical protein